MTKELGKKLGLCIGINDYPGADSDLHGCVNDATDWSATLRARGFDCRMLLDQEATGEAIREALIDLTRECVSGDIVVVTFSGHGSFVPDEDGDEDDGADECWCPHDVMRNGPITDDEMHEIFSVREEGVRWIVISDSCHSGTVTRFAPIATPATTRDVDAPQRLVRFLAPGVFLEPKGRVFKGKSAERVYRASPPGREGSLLMSGCQDTEYSYDAWFESRPNGAFTFVALRELAKLADDDTYQNWHDRIRRALPSQQYPQAPNLFGPKRMRRWTVLAAEGEARSSGVFPATSGKPSGAGSADGSHEVQESLDRGYAQAAQAIAERRRPRAGAKSRKTSLIAEGDSWFDFPWVDVLSCLEDDHGFDVSSVAHKGDTVEDMAYSGGQLKKFLRKIDKMIDRGTPPRAVLLSAGGNDIVGDEFAQLLNHAASPDRGLNKAIVDAVLDGRIRNGYATIIGAVTEICQRRLGRRLPVLIHGYSYAVPDGRGFWGGWWVLPGPWLEPGFNRKGYNDTREMQGMVDVLIDRMNEMQGSLVRSPGFEHVRHIDLRDAFPRGENYMDWWSDELHPTRSGFEKVAERFAAALRGLGS